MSTTTNTTTCDQKNDASESVTSLPGHVTPSLLGLLQALNDDNQEAIQDALTSADVFHFINTPVLCTALKNPPSELHDGLEFVTCLIFFCQFSRASAVRQLVNAGASVDVTDALGHVSLHAACVRVDNPGEVDRIHRVPLGELLREDAPLLDSSEDSPHPVLRMPLGDDWFAAPSAAIAYQFREVALLGQSTRVVHFEQPRFAWR